MGSQQKLGLIPEKIKIIFLLFSGIFLFICSLEGVGLGFKLMFKEYTKIFLSMLNSGVAPFAGLAIGVLATTLLESSSAVVATTMMSMASMVESGFPLASSIRFGVPIVLGANVGTTVGNTITLFAIRRSTTKEEFNATIPGVIVDDIYKFLSVSLFFTLEATTGFLSAIVTELGYYLFELLKLEEALATFENTIIDILIEEPIVKPLGNVFTNVFGTRLSGLLLFILWFLMVVLAIDFFISKGLKMLIQTDWAERISQAFETPVKGFLTGFTITWLVGSSSIGTSLAIPMIATKMVTLKMAYPYLCGCSLATTVDLAQIYGYIAGGVVGVMLGLAHVLLNIMALIIWLVTPLRTIPVKIANIVGGYISGKPYSALLLVGYSVGVFIILPLIVILFM